MAARKTKSFIIKLPIKGSIKKIQEKRKIVAIVVWPLGKLKSFGNKLGRGILVSSFIMKGSNAPSAAAITKISKDIIFLNAKNSPIIMIMIEAPKTSPRRVIAEKKLKRKGDWLFFMKALRLLFIFKPKVFLRMTK